MSTFWRILQLTTLAIVFFVVSGATTFLIRLWDGGLLERWRHAPFTGGVGDESLAMELATLPVVLGVLACWGVVRLLQATGCFRRCLSLVVGRNHACPMNRILKSVFGDHSSEPHNRSIGGAYTVDARDSVQPLAGFPQSSIGAPTPIVIASEDALFVAFYLIQRDPNWDGKTCKVVMPETDDEPVAVVRFSGPTAHFFGPPNDEAFSGHPLAARGLGAYGAFEVLSSSWIRALERMNSVHPCHRPESFSDCRHFILTFHDTTFECIADSFTIEQPSGSLRSVVSGLAASL